MSKRLSNVELLRIFSMLLIIAGHYFNHGFHHSLPLYPTMGQKVSCFLPLGNIGVHLFVLISGYFMVNLAFSLKRLAKLACTISIYSLGIYLIFSFIPQANNTLSASEIIHHLFPIMYNKYWFISTYVQLMLLAPFLNEFIHAAGARKTLFSLGVCALICVYFRIETKPLLLFVLLYSIAGYIRVYALEAISKIPARVYLIASCLLLIVEIGTLYGVHIAKYQLHCKWANRLASLWISSPYSLLLIFTSLLCFLGFLRVQIAPNKLINTFAAATLGVYLIHEHNAMRNFIWQDLLHTGDMLSSPYLYLHCIGAVLGIFIVCAGIDILRNAILHRPISYLVDKLISPPERMLEGMVSRCSHYLTKE